MSGDELKIPLRISTDQIAADLASVDREIGRLQERMVAAFNRSPAVRRGRVARAGSVEDVGPNREYWTPEVRSLEGRLNKRLQQIERAAQRGETRPPLTPFQAHQQAARTRLQQVERQTRPTEITARAEFFDKMRQGLLRGGTNAAALAGAQTGIPGAAGMARTLMGLVEGNPLLAGIVGGGLLAGGGALIVNQQQAQFQRQQAALASSLVGGPALGDARTVLGLGLAAQAPGLGASVGEAQGAAQALAAQNPAMPASAVTGNVQSVLALTKGLGLSQADIVPIVSALGTAGGMKSSQIADVLRDTILLSGGAAGSLQQLTLGLKALSAVNPAAASPAALAAVQRAVGATSGINAGQLMAPAMSAFGSQMLGAAGLLGMAPEQYTAAQRSKAGVAQIFAAAGRFMQTMPHDAVGQELGVQLLAQQGIIDISGLKTDQLQQLGQTWQRNPAAALRYLQQNQDRTTPPRRKPKPPTLRQLTQPGITRNVGVWQSLGNWWSLLTTQAVNQTAGPPASAGAPGMGAPVPQMFPIATGGGGRGKSGLSLMDPALLAGAASVIAAQPATAPARAGHGEVAHNLKIEVTVKDQRGNHLGHKVDTTRVVVGANTTNRPPYDHPGRSSPPPWTGGGTGGHGSGGGSSGFD